MKIRVALCLLAAVALSLGSTSCGNKAASVDNSEVAVIDTNYGKIVIEFFPDAAPKHVENFKELVRENFYEGTKFHRLVKNQGAPIAIQGGDPNTISGDPSTWGHGQPAQKTVPAEFSRTLTHERGTVSAARRGEDVNSATSQFFICTAPNPSWNGNYSIFGKVIEGMNVVDSIARAPLFSGTDRPVDPVVVNKITLVKRQQPGQ
ncbi:MAG TPA: peptidylprolyl isomerase [Blastocatellia bacterium]|jgi:cyclophilin family peptidyl-prolyl cis-trans isomerase|nr:peptidylprolyl isomerase [Blastocatellia bacterium]